MVCNPITTKKDGHVKKLYNIPNTPLVIKTFKIYFIWTSNSIILLTRHMWRRLGSWKKKGKRRKNHLRAMWIRLTQKKNWKLIAPKITETQKLLYHKSLAVDTGFILITSGAKERWDKFTSTKLRNLQKTKNGLSQLTKKRRLQTNYFALSLLWVKEW